MLMPNYALERSVTGLVLGAAGARTIVAPAALSEGFTRPAQTRTLDGIGEGYAFDFLRTTAAQAWRIGE
jgi:hypothetical protein